VVRYNTDGSLDSGFDFDGKVTTAVGAGHDWANSVAIQGDGKIVAVGYTFNGSDGDFAVVRYSTDGSLDTSFDGDGKVATAMGPGVDSATDVAFQADGKILVTGEGANRSNLDFAVARYQADGSLGGAWGQRGGAWGQRCLGSERI